MSRLRQGFSWWCFANRGVAADALLAGAARIGLESVDLAGEELWPLIRDRGLKLGAVAGHASITSGLNQRENADRIVAELRVSLQKAVRWEIPILICFSGNRCAQGGEAGLDVCAETLSRLAPEAENAGVTLALELLNSKVDHPGYEADSTSWGLRLCEKVGSPAVKILYDIYHLHIMEGDVLRSIREHHAEFAHYHTAGHPGRGQPDASQEMNYPAIYRAIAATGTKACVSHEFLPSGDPLAALEKAFRDCVEAAG